MYGGASQATKMHGLHSRHALLQTTLNKTNTITICQTILMDISEWKILSFEIPGFLLIPDKHLTIFLIGTLLSGTKYTTRWEKNYTAGK